MKEFVGARGEFRRIDGAGSKDKNSSMGLASLLAGAWLLIATAAPVEHPPPAFPEAYEITVRSQGGAFWDDDYVCVTSYAVSGRNWLFACTEGAPHFYLEIHNAETAKGYVILIQNSQYYVTDYRPIEWYRIPLTEEDWRKANPRFEDRETLRGMNCLKYRYVIEATEIELWISAEDRHPVQMHTSNAGQYEWLDFKPGPVPPERFLPPVGFLEVEETRYDRSASRVPTVQRLGAPNKEPKVFVPAPPQEEEALPDASWMNDEVTVIPRPAPSGMETP